LNRLVSAYRNGKTADLGVQKVSVRSCSRSWKQMIAMTT